MAVAVVAALELVHVDEAERHLAARLLRPLERLAQAALVGAVVAEPGEAVGERVARRHAGGEGGALVEREREERAGEEDEEPRVGRPERRGQGGEEGHDHEGRARVPEVLAGQRQEALAGEDGERAADEHDVDDHVGGAAGEGEEGDHPEPARVAEQEDGKRRGERGQPVDRRVEDRAHEWPALDHLRDEHAEDRAQDGVLPAEEDLARHHEDERERDDALVLDVERDGLHVREEREPEEENHPDACRDVGAIQRYSHHSPGGHRQSDAEDGGDVPVEPGWVSVSVHCLRENVVGRWKWAAGLVPAEPGAGCNRICGDRPDDEHGPNVVMLPSNHARSPPSAGRRWPQERARPLCAGSNGSGRAW